MFQMTKVEEVSSVVSFSTDRRSDKILNNSSTMLDINPVTGQTIQPMAPTCSEQLLGGSAASARLGSALASSGVKGLVRSSGGVVVAGLVVEGVSSGF